ncbi:MAG: ABC transporter ATP-binding protein [Verrucomicrobiae bacterium]|nr:ABC transporter ATP-binding protein [Verrucomicrobiae bacterium]
MKLQLTQVSKRFGPTTVVAGVSFEIQNGEMFFLLGPSGCGKTTVLRMVAGFYQPDAGEIRFDDQVVNVLPPNKRNTGMVFQNYALWPHMSVAENVGYGLDVRNVAETEKDKRVREALAIVQMTPYAERSPTQLSGGQQQRVALARALVIKPDILLLDEPLSNLDAKLRLEMRDEIKRIHREVGLTTLYVTHDQKEALSLADRIAIMNQGAIEQIGSPREIYRAPKNRFVAQFIGEMNLVSGTVDRIDVGRDVALAANVLVQTKVGILRGHSNVKLDAGQKVQCGFRPEAVRIGADGSNAIASIVQDTTYLGEVEQFHLKLNDGTEIKAQSINPDRPHKRGELLEFALEPRDLIVLAD